MSGSIWLGPPCTTDKDGMTCSTRIAALADHLALRPRKIAGCNMQDCPGNEHGDDQSAKNLGDAGL